MSEIHRCLYCQGALKLLRAYGDPYFECSDCGAKYEAVLMPRRMFALPADARPDTRRERP